MRSQGLCRVGLHSSSLEALPSSICQAGLHNPHLPPTPELHTAYKYSQVCDYRNWEMESNKLRKQARNIKLTLAELF